MTHTLYICHRRDVYFKDFSCLDTLTNWCSGGHGFSHTELLFPDGRAFSSFPKDAEKVGGVQWFTRKEGYRGDWWVMTPIFLDTEQYDKLVAECDELVLERIQKKSGYDYTGVSRFVLPWLKEHPDNYFCTEAVVTVLGKVWFDRASLCNAIHALKKPWKIAPNTLAKVCGE